jgi:hypothetical protein
MAEDRNITFNVKFKIEGNVTNAFNITLKEKQYESGKESNGAPPSQVTLSSGEEQSVTFGACGAKDSASGTEGHITFVASAYGDFKIEFDWDIPYSSANSGGVLLINDTNQYYKISGDTSIGPTGNSKSLTTIITQVGPTT